MVADEPLPTVTTEVASWPSVWLKVAFTSLMSIGPCVLATGIEIWVPPTKSMVKWKPRTTMPRMQTSIRAPKKT